MHFPASPQKADQSGHEGMEDLTESTRPADKDMGDVAEEKVRKTVSEKERRRKNIEALILNLPDSRHSVFSAANNVAVSSKAAGASGLLSADVGSGNVSSGAGDGMVEARNQQKVNRDRVIQVGVNKDNAVDERVEDGENVDARRAADREWDRNEDEDSDDDDDDGDVGVGVSDDDDNDTEEKEAEEDSGFEIDAKVGIGNCIFTYLLYV